MALLASDGSVDRLVRIGDLWDDVAYDVAVAPSGWYVCGVFAGSSNLLGTQLDAVGLSDAFVAAITDSGDATGVLRLGGGGADGCRTITVAGDAVFVGGYHNGALSPSLPTITSGSDGFLLRIDPSSGIAHWALNVGGSGDDSVLFARQEALLGDTGPVLVVGNYSGLVRISDIWWYGGGGVDGFVLEVQPDDGGVGRVATLRHPEGGHDVLEEVAIAGDRIAVVGNTSPADVFAQDGIILVLPR